MNSNPGKQPGPDDVPDTAREVMPPIQFFGDDRMKAVEGGKKVRDFTPKVEEIDTEAEAEQGAPPSEEFDTDTSAVNAEENGDDNPPEETPVEQPKNGDSGDDNDDDKTATQKAAKD